MIYCDVRSEAYEFLVRAPVILHVNLIGINIDNLSTAVGHHLSPGVNADSLFKSGTDNRRLRSEKRNGLTHHVRTHECTVGVIMLEERNEGCGHGSHLVRSHVHIVNLLLCDNREVGLETALDSVVLDDTVIGHLHIGKGNELVLFLLGTHEFPSLVAEINLSVVDLAVWCLDESEIVNLGIYAEGRNKSDVRSLRRLDRTKSSVMRVVYVPDLESCPVPGETSRTEG